MKTKTATLKVEPGQYWIPNDRSQTGRVVRVNRIEGKYAHCTTMWKGKSPTDVKILLTRFTPKATGFRRINFKDHLDETSQVAR